MYGIEVVREEESWTSKVSSASGNIEILQNKRIKNISEEEVKNLKLEGKRIKRGLFIDLKLKKAFNADLNGALNLAIKALGRNTRETFFALNNWLDKLSRPIKVNLFRYPASLPIIREIAGSISCFSKRSSEGYSTEKISKVITNVYLWYFSVGVLDFKYI